MPRFWLRLVLLLVSAPSMGALATVLSGCRPTAGSAQLSSVATPSAGAGVAAASPNNLSGPAAAGAAPGTAASASYRPVLNQTLCVDVAGDLNAAGEAIVLASCAPVPTQNWQLSGGKLMTEGRCLDVANSNATVGASLALKDCADGAATQAWSYAAAHLQLGQTGFCMAVPSPQAQAGQSLQLATCAQNANVQLFEQNAANTTQDPNSAARRIDIVNRCPQSIYANNGTSSFVMAQNTNVTSFLPYGWSGRIWARIDCAISGTTATCGDGIPLTLAEFTFDGWGGGGTATLDYYDISLVDGFNITMQIAPQGGSGNCHAPTCDANLLLRCAQDLQQLGAQGQVIACLSGCSRYHTDADCCQNANNTTATCPQPATAVAFKQACPDAYSYAYDDSSSTWTCARPTGYTVTFCPS